MTVNSQTIELAGFDEHQFVETFGGLYECSPWIAQRTWHQIKTQPGIQLNELASKLKSTVDDSEHNEKLELLRAHPELAGKAALQGSLTAESTVEQSSARLDQCTVEELERFHQLNAAYNAKFEFPFIMAVRNSTRAEILQAFETRLHNGSGDEFNTALENVHQIAQLRLMALFDT